MKNWNTVADLIAASFGSTGQLTNTKGYTTAGDGGAGTYMIKTAAQAATDGDTIDEIGAGFTLADTKVAVLQNTTLSLKLFGAIGDGVTDNTLSIQASFDYCRDKKRSLAIDDNSIFITDALRLEGVAGSDIESFELYGFGNTSVIKSVVPDIHMIFIGNGTHTNIHIHNFKMINAGSISTTERHCINFGGTSTTNFTVENMYLEDTDGDGVYLRDTHKGTVRNIYCKDTRRQGVALIRGSDVLIENIRGEGDVINLVDIEPNSGDVIERVTINNIRLENPSQQSALRILGDATATITGLNISNIDSDTLSISYATKVNATNLILRTNAIFSAFDLFNCDKVNISNVAITGVFNFPRVKISSCNNVKLSSFEMDCVGVSFAVDILGSTKTTLRDFDLLSIASVGVRVRDSSDFKIHSANMTGDIGTESGVTLIPTTSNDRVSISGLTTTNLGTGINLFGAHDTVMVSDSDLSGATTPVNVDGGFVGSRAFNNVLGYSGVFIAGAAAPTTGTFARGDKFYDRNATAAGKMGNVCVTAGTPGTWRAFGAIDA